MKKIEDKVLSITNERLTKKLEDEWSTLEALQHDLQNRMVNQKNDINTIRNTFSQAELLFTNPVKFWKNSQYEIRQLLIMVWFG